VEKTLKVDKQREKKFIETFYDLFAALKIDPRKKKNLSKELKMKNGNIKYFCLFFSFFLVNVKFYF